MRTEPSVNAERPIRPTKLRVKRAPLSSLSTKKPLPVHRANTVEPTREIIFANKTISKALTPFSLQAILVPQMKMNWQMACKFVATTAFNLFVLITLFASGYGVETEDKS